ncbi:hypothetical protein [Rhodococcus opacus]|uniref:hypothetical protein n=1 Tax=Rhodococcus opacus TaxID=37919 RepID=UPI00247346D3|nr:hypothetical protein [Rhodococcus opacus]MDH6293183.1 NADPH-dependent glutamate synthase beta subunit-like oxidoreductase [Rhodococcus opacus]
MSASTAGHCRDACPVGAISPDHDLIPEMAPYEQINADYYAATGSAADLTLTPWQDPTNLDMSNAPDAGPLRVAIIGTGAAETLLEQADVPVRIDMFERLCTPVGLVRFGVAPAHQQTKQVQRAFDRTMAHNSVRAFFNVEIGRDITHTDLLRRYQAVVYTVGASEGKLGVPEEDLRNIAAWFSGHPDFADRTFDLSHERAVVIGNGNVAVDVARILTADPDDVAQTDIADHALAALPNLTGSRRGVPRP